MGVVSNEPSMEDILSSIKRIIADGSDRAQPSRAARRRPGGRVDEDLLEPDVDGEIDRDSDAASEDTAHAGILELTEPMDEPADSLPPAATADASLEQDKQAQPVQAAGILSDSSTMAARQSLINLSSMLVRPQDGESNTLEGLVRDMLRPMLKDWMEDNLPGLVEGMVKKEIDRIVGRLG